ncbi:MULTISPECIES: hypothetical protein [Streptococcus]|uniref:hypothetical protein n=1 Tax=Streptococcus TaxID=1301 RepID=UPI00034D7871|nr:MULTISPECIES: hypothetical protein [Streptococcus]MCW1049812.1 hypothetical protein [Streptococcus anginosus]MDK6672919.1 hypothetical protein [Streptococcus agalactiae]MED5763421.1 hypothetical protein [Streptococcus anginosus]
MAREYYLYVRGEKVKVSEQIYKNQHKQWIVNLKNFLYNKMLENNYHYSSNLLTIALSYR